MKPIPSIEIPPKNKEFVYEVKYDGFRAVLHLTKKTIKLTSINNKDFTNNFPEIISYCKEKRDLLLDFLPLKLDGELVILNNKYQANFSLIQKRGRLKNQANIVTDANNRPATFMVFD